jgi:hypothetical protein
MKRHILALRLNRRAVGAVVLTDEALTMTEGRHLTSNRARAVSAAVRYIARILSQSGATAVVLDAPVANSGTTMRQLLDEVLNLLASQGLKPLLIGKGDLLAAYGMAIRTRSEVRDIVNVFWPELARITARFKPYTADAAAAALYAECCLALSPPPT